MIPKIIEMEADLPDGMTEEQLEKLLRPNLLAFARILARDIKNQNVAETRPKRKE
ncbi:hypothetical protein [Thermosediminibacter oceani]|uniref:Uncharacterized protein n=1 Tax=Thermosediminibacter oceani (strain ATCC BAA-1034 / DSM 16646 / JW/IW-1228P) TaxID=555079 RepID=D9S119_THEOJ|nr:hypothetical protein [Thermosediminibacter oceani]ADL07183.1 hypothetical protein Toce_0403 [Thermosediminibacter oceani DSM 16646]